MQHNWTRVHTRSPKTPTWYTRKTLKPLFKGQEDLGPEPAHRNGQNWSKPGLLACVCFCTLYLSLLGMMVDSSRLTSLVCFLFKHFNCLALWNYFVLMSFSITFYEPVLQELSLFLFCFSFGVAVFGADGRGVWQRGWGRRRISQFVLACAGCLGPEADKVLKNPFSIIVIVALFKDDLDQRFNASSPTVQCLF